MTDIVLECRTCARRTAVPVDGADWVCFCGETDYRIVPVENVAETLERDRDRWRADYDRWKTTDEGPDR